MMDQDLADIVGTPSAETDVDLPALAARLEASGLFRVLRRLPPRSVIEEFDGSEVRRGVFVDVETTGLDPDRDEIIELAMVPFTYGLDGRIFCIHDAFQGFSQPKQPIPPEVTALTGITDEMVAGRTIDVAQAEEFVESAALIVAHNAAFDRRFIEHLSPVFIGKPWACSMTQIDWTSAGFEGTKLAYLAMGAGFFYDRHRAVNDCLAAIELLASRQQKSNTPFMAQLLERARTPTWRIWAEGAPYEVKDVLKARGYRWNGEGKPRAWYTDVDDHARKSELDFLRAEIYRREAAPSTTKITAYERFSIRSSSIEPEPPLSR
ncbi:3'-5' exonuclease [Agrobacterium rubi]|uniref:3'-5' exonuclease n=1 Tax=Agrobacterium rubi TaxID=28099 RepID=UPI001F3637D4|nr:3'-5' exonuclease [Agrobacterium rubi]